MRGNANCYIPALDMRMRLCHNGANDLGKGQTMMNIHSAVALLKEIANDNSIHGSELRDVLREVIEEIEAS